MNLNKEHKKIFLVFKAFTFILLLILNLPQIKEWNFTVVLSILPLVFIFNLYMMRRFKEKTIETKDLNIKIWGNCILVTLLLWYMGGINNASYHIYYAFIIITTFVLVDKIQGIILFNIPIIASTIMYINNTISLEYYLSYVYMMTAFLLVGFFITSTYKNNQILGKKAREYETLYKISKIIDTFPNTDVILNNIAQVVAKSLETDECLIMLYDDKKDLLYSRARYGVIDHENINAVFSKGEGISGKVLTTKEAVISSDLERDKDIIDSFKYNFEIKSCAILPLIQEDDAIGVIAVYSKGKYNFNITTVDLLNTIASRIVRVLENDKLYKKLMTTSKTDGLTGLYNHRYFYEVMNEEIQRGARENTNFFLLILDIDKFKNFNDRYGHLIGDKVLAEISNIIRENIRKTDIAARYGGEEFAIIIPNSSWQITQKIAERIKEGVKRVGERIKELRNEDTQVTISVGISCYPHCAEDIEELIEKADKRMYRGKEIGGDNVIYINSNIS